MVAATAALAASVGGSAWAYFLSTGTGTASARIGMLSAPGTPSVPATSTGTVSVEWTASSTSGGAVTPQGYYVTRTSGGTTSPACGSNPASLITGGTSCSDTSVPSGTYAYAVTAVYNSWSATSPDSSSVVVQTDTTPPTSAASTPQYASGAFTPSYVASDTGGSGLKQIQLYVKGPGDSTYSTAGSAVSVTGNSASGNFASYTPSEGNGSYSFYAIATDNAGNTQTVPTSAQSTTIEDQAAPSASASSPQYDRTGSFTLSYSASDTGGSGLKSVQLFAKGPSDSAYSAVGSSVTLSGENASGNFPTYTASEGNGSYSFYAIATDNAGNVQTTPASAQSTTTEDNIAPASAIAFPAASTRYNAAGWTAGCNAAPFNVTDSICGTASDATSGVKQVQVSVQQGAGNYWNGTSFGSATEQKLSATGTTNWALSLSASNFPADGAYTVRVYATDNAGNAQSTPTSTTFTIDTTAPAVTLTQVNGSGVAFPYSSTAAVTSIGGACGTATGDVSTVSWAVTGSATQSGSATCSSGSWSATLSSSLTTGSYTLSATQSDAAGNSGSSGSKSLTVSSAAETATLLGSNSSSPCTSLNASHQCAGPSITTTSGSTELILITDKGSQSASANASSVTCTCFSGTGGAASTVATASYGSPAKNEVDVWVGTGAGGSAANVTVAMASNESTSDMVVTVIQLTNNNTTTPVAQSTINGLSTAGTTASTTAFTTAPVTGDGGLVFFGANHGVSMTTPASPSNITSLLQSTDTTHGSSFGIYFTPTAQQSAITTTLAGSGSPWGAIALDIAHP